MVTTSPPDQRHGEPEPGTPVGRLREHLRNLRHALLWGPDAPPPFFRRDAVRLARMLVVVAMVPLGVLLVLTLPSSRLRPGIGSVWWPWFALTLLLTLTVLLVMFRRPLLAWRLIWLALCYEVIRGLLTAGGWSRWAGVNWLPQLVPPEVSPLLPVTGLDGFALPSLVVSPLQAAVGVVVLFVVALSQSRGVVWWVWVLTASLVAAAPVIWRFGEYLRLDGWGPGWPTGVRPMVAVVGGVLLVTAAVVAGQLVRRQSRTEQRLAEVQERGLLLDERTRLARELHDVVAHHVSMIAVRAETAPYRIGELSVQARAEFAEISQASRESLTEMRRLLGVLRSDAPVPLGPQPGLADLAELVEWTRAAGTAVRLETHGALAGLPAAVDLSAYRILREALTNAARHATGAAVHLRLERTESELRMSVRNGPRHARTGRDRAARSPADGGHGIRGMRERAAMLGGELHAGPTPDGGFEVTATLPLRGGAA